MAKHKGHWTRCFHCEKKFVCNDKWPYQDDEGAYCCWDCMDESYQPDYIN